MDLIRIGSFLAELRREKGLTQQALGERLGVTNKTISRWETGCYLPDVEMLSLLSREFGVSINELVAGERLVAEDFKKAADENLVTALDHSTFTLKEKQAFFKKKWRREHSWVYVRQYCAEIDEAARNRMELIVRSLVEQNGVTEQLKAENQMEWVRQMNACKAQAEEVVKAELIYD